MLLGTSTIYVDVTEGDEFGVYRTNDSGQGFLLFAFSDKDEALKIGFEISNILNIPFNSKFHKDKEMQHKNNLKKTQVRGIKLLCKQIIAEGKDTEEIIEILTPKYIEAGRTEKYARETIKWYLKETAKT